MYYVSDTLHSISKTFSNTVFLFDVAFGVLYDYLIFLHQDNYCEFIRSVAKTLAKKNILYVKMFQAISLNNNLIDGAMNNELLKYTDSAPYTDEDIDEDLLRDIVKKYHLTPENDVLPSKSGMISLVYKMKTAENEEVIIKVKRKNINERLDAAIEKLVFFINVLSLIPQFNVLDISTVIKKNIALLREQLDFQQEVKNTLEMQENCKNLKYIKIPSVYQEFTTEFPDAIMMEYVKGIHIVNLSDKDYDQYAKLVMKYGFVSIINNSVTHGDLHAGNIIFIKNSEGDSVLGLIDFGIVTRINEETTKTFLEVVSGAFSEPSRTLAEKILNNVIEPRESFKFLLPATHKDRMYESASKIIEETIHNSKEASQLKIYEFIQKFNEYVMANDLAKYGLYISDDFVKLQMALAMSQGVSLCLCKNDFIPLANEVLNELFHTDLLFTDSQQ